MGCKPPESILVHLRRGALYTPSAPCILSILPASLLFTTLSSTRQTLRPASVCLRSCLVLLAAGLASAEQKRRVSMVHAKRERHSSHKTQPTAYPSRVHRRVERHACASFQTQSGAYQHCSLRVETRLCPQAGAPPPFLRPELRPPLGPLQ